VINSINLEILKTCQDQDEDCIFIIEDYMTATTAHASLCYGRHVSYHSLYTDKFISHNIS